jgi:CDP-diacylglycerol---glycerol-3-phosphate 3-phosphatidyltransferase
VNNANTITVVRILLIPVFVVLALSHVRWGSWFAIAVFSLAAMTDGVDGYIARSRNQVTTVGKFLDPIADKLLISAALIALVDLNKLPAWIAMVIIGREFAVSALRAVAIDQGVVIPASVLGKVKTITQIVVIIILLWPHGHLWYAPLVEYTAMYTMVIITLISGAQYFLRARDLLSAPQEPHA